MEIKEKEFDQEKLKKDLKTYEDMLQDPKDMLKAYKPEFTDDASVLEAFGEKINLIEGNRENIKITTEQDLIIAEALMDR